MSNELPSTSSFVYDYIYIIFLSKSKFIYFLLILFYRTEILNGRRIVDIGHIFNEIQNSRHSGGFGCSFLDMIFKREEKQGYFSIFYFHCKMCGIEKKITSENTNNFECIPINKAVVNATIAIGNTIKYLKRFY